jgi:hypothetical protein
MFPSAYRFALMLPLLSKLCFASALGLQLDLPVGEGHKSGVRRTNLVLLPTALALCPDLARGENQMSTSTDNNAHQEAIFSWFIP